MVKKILTKSYLSIVTAILLSANMSVYAIEASKEEKNINQTNFPLSISVLPLSISVLPLYMSVCGEDEEKVLQQQICRINSLLSNEELNANTLKEFDEEIATLLTIFQATWIWKINDDRYDLSDSHFEFQNICKQVYDGSYNCAEYKKEELDDILRNYLIRVDESYYFNDVAMKVKKLAEDMRKTSDCINAVNKRKIMLLELSKSEKEIKTPQG